MTQQIDSKCTIQEIHDKEVWESFILKNSPQSFFQSYLWGEVLEKSDTKQKIWRLGVYANTQWVGVAQVIKVVAKRGMFLHVRHGPIFLQWKKEYVAELLSFLIKLARAERAVFIRISPLIENTADTKKFLADFGFHPAPIHAMDSELCWLLDITHSEAELLSGMRKTTRYLIRQKEKYEVTVKHAHDVTEFMQLYRKTAKRHQFVPHHLIAEEFSVFSRENKALMLLGYAQAKLIAAAMVVFYGNQAIYRHGASLQSKIPVSYIVQWEAIKEAKKRQFSLYNFWGIAPADKPNHPWHGITLFKKGFGGYEKQYAHAHDLPLSIGYGLPYMIETMRRIKKGY